MEEETKTQGTSGSNPNGADDVNPGDLDQGGQTPPADDGNQGGETKNQGEGDQKPNPPKQTRETDAANAERRRREKAREEARRAEREAEIRRQAVFEVESGQVTSGELQELGLEKVETEEQLFLVKSLRKAKAAGVENPQAVAYQDLFKKQQSERAEAAAQAEATRQAEERSKKVVAEDQANFKTKFGKTTAEVIKNEPEFMRLFGDLIGEGNFTKLYTAYTELRQNQSNVAKREGSFPTNGSGGQTPSGEETDADFRKRFEATYGHW